MTNVPKHAQVPQGVYGPPVPQRVFVRTPATCVFIVGNRLLRGRVFAEAHCRAEPARATSRGVIGYRYRRCEPWRVSAIPVNRYTVYWLEHRMG